MSHDPCVISFLPDMLHLNSNYLVGGMAKHIAMKIDGL